MNTTIFHLTNETDYLPVQPLLIETPAVYKFTASFPQLDHKTIQISQLSWKLWVSFQSFYISGARGTTKRAQFEKSAQIHHEIRMHFIHQNGVTILKQSTTAWCFPLKFIVPTSSEISIRYDLIKPNHSLQRDRSLSVCFLSTQHCPYHQWSVTQLVQTTINCNELGIRWPR